MARAAGQSLDLEDDIFNAGLDDADTFDSTEQEPSLPVRESPDERLVSEAIRRQVRTDPRGRAPAPAEDAPQRPGSPDTNNPAIQGLLKELAEERRLRREYEQRNAPKAPEEPEVDVAEMLFQNPRQVLDGIKQELRSEFARTMLTRDLERGEDKYGETFQEAFGTFMNHIQGTRDRYTYERVMAQPSQSEAIMQWYRQHQVLQRVGDDPDAYERSVIERYLAGQGGGELPQERPQPSRARDESGRFASQPPRREIRLPTATSRIPGASSGGSLDAEDGSEEAIFEAGRAPRSRR